MNLNNLEINTDAIIMKICIACEYSERLAGMGIIPGRKIKVIKNGDPMIIFVSGSYFGMSSSLAEEIEVEGII